MTEKGYVKSYRELIVYQKARGLSKELFKLTRSFPKEETYSLTDQGRRSSRSVGAQIAEAWGLRKYEKHFIARLTGADGEQQETQHWIETAADCGYLDAEVEQSLLVKCEEIGRMLNGMISKSEMFCGDPPRKVNETKEDYE